MKKPIKPDKKHSGRWHLALSFSFGVFLLIIIASYWIFTFYQIMNAIPYIDVSNLPRYTNDIIIAVLSLLIGVIASLLFKRKIINPLYEIYEAIDSISKGDFSVKIKPEGIKTVKDVIDKINTMTDELDSMETMRNDFINNFSHEFKTPIISISGFAKILKNKELTAEEKEEYLDIIISESDRLALLSTNILNLSRLEHQTILPGKKLFNVSEQIRLVIVLLENKWSGKNIEIELDSDEYRITGHEETLQQLWINLIDNAIKYSPKGSQILIETAKADDCLIFTFTDHGKGMTEEEAKRAFDRFYQGDISHKTGGNGIGLPMAKKICELHDGTISIKRTDENGTTIEVVLPC